MPNARQYVANRSGVAETLEDGGESHGNVAVVDRNAEGNKRKTAEEASKFSKLSHIQKLQYREAVELVQDYETSFLIAMRDAQRCIEKECGRRVLTVEDCNLKMTEKMQKAFFQFHVVCLELCVDTIAQSFAHMELMEEMVQHAQKQYSDVWAQFSSPYGFGLDTTFVRSSKLVWDKTQQVGLRLAFVLANV
ncbi:hypothetical protein OAM67_00400 [bacterium]|nr:hypothetical protein [bacterium]